MADDTCWQCGGDGHLGSACIDDMCYGGDIPCCHGEEDAIRCDVCSGKGRLPDDGDDDDDAGMELADDMFEMDEATVTQRLEAMGVTEKDLERIGENAVTRVLARISEDEHVHASVNPEKEGPL
jgi:hypothetical protein